MVGLPFGKLSKIGDLLCEMELISREQLEIAIKEQEVTHEMISNILIKRGFATETSVARVLSDALGLPFIKDPAALAKPAALKMVPESLARRTISLPLDESDKGLCVAMADPLNLDNLDDLSYAANSRIRPMVAAPTAIKEAIASLYGTIDPIAELIRGIELNQVEVISAENVDLDKLIESDLDAPIVKLVNLIILEAVRQRASDIHIDPTTSLTRVRFRVDGLLRDIMSPSKKAHTAICSRIKILAGLNIAEHRIPQDGRTLIKTREGKEVDLRINVIPTIYGEKITLRVLEQDADKLNLGNLFQDRKSLNQFLELTHRPNGIVLVVGPTGSGKSTTLYSALKELNSQTLHIITIEDPVEYRIESINQIQVNAKTGLTFATGLRAVLRQDPNVILVGEIRDQETAEVAFEAAMTGHFVLSTLHSTDAAHTIARLATLNINPFVSSSALTGIISVRLVRRLCQACREPYAPKPDIIAMVKNSEKAQFYRARGCTACRQTGYNGRVGIYEIVPVTGTIKELIQSGASIGELQAALARMDIRSLWLDGLEKVFAGTTTFDEVMRVTRNYLFGDEESAFFGA